MVVVEPFNDYASTVSRCLAVVGADRVIAGDTPVMLKPNLINASPHPVTTPPAFCEAVIAFIRRHTDAPVVIAEGCGDAGLETPDVFDRLGYVDLAKKTGAALLDLNTAPLVYRKDPDCRVLPEIWLPGAVFDHILISLPVLKAHSLCALTGSMKNMMGLLPPRHYAGRHGSWKKAAVHHRLDEAIVDLNRYRSPDLTVMDATIGLAAFHLGGPACQPPVNRILAGSDAAELDREAAGLIGIDWRTVGHLYPDSLTSRQT